MDYYIIDAFAENIFEGNPAAIFVLDSWIADDLMQKITIENNLSETAFTVQKGAGYELRWFTPGGEIELCGHATLATAYVLANFITPTETCFTFQTKSGVLSVMRQGELYEMDFPAFELTQIPVTDLMEEVIGYRPIEAWMGKDLVCVLDDESKVFTAHLDYNKMLNLDGLMLHITAHGKNYDCESRSFAPKLDVKEDPVCGRCHCHITPIWSRKLNKESIYAHQASSRGGILTCSNNGDRVKLAGKAVLFAKGTINSHCFSLQ